MSGDIGRPGVVCGCARPCPGGCVGRLRRCAPAPEKRPPVETTLQQRAGILAVKATPLTGRLLVYYDTGLTPEEIAAMVHAALQVPAHTHGASGIPPKATAGHRNGESPIARVRVGTQSQHLACARAPLRGRGCRPLNGYRALTHWVPVHLQGMLLVPLLALTVVQSWMATGMLLLFALLITPMSTAGLLTARLTPWLVYWIGFASWSAWLGFWMAAQSIWLPAVFIAMSSCALHLGVRCLVATMGHAPRLLADGRRQL
jgi:ABC 3 transport family